MPVAGALPPTAASEVVLVVVETDGGMKDGPLARAQCDACGVDHGIEIGFRQLFLIEMDLASMKLQKSQNFRPWTLAGTTTQEVGLLLRNLN